MRDIKKVKYLNEFDEIEKIIQYNLSNRGLDKVKLHGQMENCTNSLNLSNTIVIVTGFPVKSAESRRNRRASWSISVGIFT